MDLIFKTELFNNTKKQYEDDVRKHFNEDFIREVISNRCVTDDIYRKLEQINIYNDFDESFIGRYDIIIDLDGSSEFSEMGEADCFFLIGYYWNEDLSGTQTNRKKRPVKFNIFKFLDDINGDFSRLI